MREVVLTDEKGNETGRAEIVQAHTGEGKLHLAFSVYLFRNNRSELLIQQREKGKLFGLYWANTCCSHPHPGEPIIEAGIRRLQEECSINLDRLQQEGILVYKAKDPEEKGVEHEYDVLLTADVDEDLEFHPHPDEIVKLEWRKVDELLQDMDVNPEKYAPWFHLGLQQILERNNA